MPSPLENPRRPSAFNLYQDPRAFSKFAIGDVTLSASRKEFQTIIPGVLMRFPDHHLPENMVAHA
jgi:hypothetical protein